MRDRENAVLRRAKELGVSETEVMRRVLEALAADTTNANTVSEREQALTRLLQRANRFATGTLL